MMLHMMKSRSPSAALGTGSRLGPASASSKNRLDAFLGWPSLGMTLQVVGAYEQAISRLHFCQNRLTWVLDKLLCARSSALPLDAPTAFFSYSREDSEFALRLAEDLKAAGAGVWIDQLDIEPGKEWDNAIEDAVTQSPRMLLILTAASVKSKKVRNEIAFALDEQKTIIPVLYQDCMIPLQLRRIQHIDFRTDYARGLKALLKALGVEQQAGASAAAATAAAVENQPSVFDAERGSAAEQEQPEEEHKPVAEKSRLEQEREASQARREEESKRAAERLQREKEERKEHAQEYVPPIQVGSAPPVFSPFQAWAKIAVPVCGILVVALVLYWATRPKQPHEATQTPAVQTQPSSPPASVEVSSGSAAAEKAAADKAAADKAAADRAAADKAGADKAAADKAAADKAAARKAAADKAAAAMQQPTESLSADEMRSLGFKYQNGDGVKKDYQQAVSWYRKAAAAGSTVAMNDLGFMYGTGQGVDTDYNQAVSWYRRAAEAGNSEGMKNLGVMYRDGLGVDKDYQQGVNWFRKAAEGGNADGMSNLGRMYQNGYGVDKDYKQAVTWY